MVKTAVKNLKNNDTATLLQDVWHDDERIFFLYQSGKIIGFPREWFPRLQSANDADLKNWRFIAEGEGVHWQTLDEDLSAEKMLVYQP
jgi:Protein of unknown function (DUF2442)